MLARVGKKTRARRENHIFGLVAPHAGIMDLEPKWIHYRSSQVIYRRSTQRSPVTLSPPKGGESVTGSLSILFSGSFFGEAGTMFRGFGAPGGIQPRGSGCVGALVRGCVRVWVCRGVLSHPPPPTTHQPTHRSAHPTHLPTYKPFYRFAHRSWGGNFFPARGRGNENDRI